MIFRQISDRLEVLTSLLSLDWITQFRYHVGQAKRDIEQFVTDPKG